MTSMKGSLYHRQEVITAAWCGDGSRDESGKRIPRSLELGDVQKKTQGMVLPFLLKFLVAFEEGGRGREGGEKEGGRERERDRETQSVFFHSMDPRDSPVAGFACQAVSPNLMTLIFFKFISAVSLESLVGLYLCYRESFLHIDRFSLLLIL